MVLNKHVGRKIIEKLINHVGPNKGVLVGKNFENK